MLQPMRDAADYILNTTGLTLSMLQNRIRGFFEGDRKRDLLVNVVSFGFKYGIPMDADMVLDVRFLPNPFYVEELRAMSGMDAPVRDYVLSSDTAQDFLDRLCGMIDFLLPQYAEEGRYALTIGVGCTGGRHRSVAVAKALADHLQEMGEDVQFSNRDLEKS